MRAFATATALALMLGISACGSGSGSGAGSTETGASTAAKKEPAEASGLGVTTGSPGEAGRVIVNQLGFTLYHFSKDKRNSGKSACYGKCAKLWPPYVTNGKPAVLGMADPSLVGTIKRKDGRAQVTYAGWPMYDYYRDRPNATRGFRRHSYGGVWYLIDPNGSVVH